MPVFRRPDVKGNLYVQFTIQFPDSGFLEESQLKVCSGYNHVICVCSVGSLSIHRPHCIHAISLCCTTLSSIIKVSL